MIGFAIAYGVFVALFLAFLFGLGRTPRRAENNSRILGQLAEQARQDSPNGDWPSVTLIDALHSRSNER
jgi:hypothetical protein